MGAILSCCSCCPCCKIEDPKVYPTPEPSIEVEEEEEDSPLDGTAMSKTNHLDLIEGYENEPLVSLKDALQPLINDIDDLEYYIQQAEKRCHYPSNPKLTRDESAAIYIYTWKWSDGCLYDCLQEAWKSEDPKQLKAWFKYLRLFKNAFDKLPDAKGEIWQGKSKDDRLQQELRSSKSPLFSVMDILSSSREAIEKSLEQKGIKEKMLIGFKSVGGKLVDLYAATSGSDVLLWPGGKVATTDIELQSTTGSLTIHMKGSYGT